MVSTKNVLLKSQLDKDESTADHMHSSVALALDPTIKQNNKKKNVKIHIYQFKDFLSRKKIRVSNSLFFTVYEWGWKFWDMVNDGVKLDKLVGWDSYIRFIYNIYKKKKVNLLIYY